MKYIIGMNLFPNHFELFENICPWRNTRRLTGGFFVPIPRGISIFIAVTLFMLATLIGAENTKCYAAEEEEIVFVQSNSSHLLWISSQGNGVIKNFKDGTEFSITNCFSAGGFPSSSPFGNEGIKMEDIRLSADGMRLFIVFSPNENIFVRIIDVPLNKVLFQKIYKNQIDYIASHRQFSHDEQMERLHLYLSTTMFFPQSIEVEQGAECNSQESTFFCYDAKDKEILWNTSTTPLFLLIKKEIPLSESYVMTNNYKIRILHEDKYLWIADSGHTVLSGRDLVVQMTLFQNNETEKYTCAVYKEAEKRFVLCGEIWDTSPILLPVPNTSILYLIQGKTFLTWDLQSEKIICREKLPFIAESANISDDGTKIIVVGSGTLGIWRMEEGKLLKDGAIIRSFRSDYAPEGVSLLSEGDQVCITFRNSYLIYNLTTKKTEFHKCSIGVHREN